MPRIGKSSEVSQSYSQSGQDRWAIDFLRGKQNGFFLEIGAGDGIYISNTLLLEREFKWTGILVEPSHSFKLLVKNRPDAICSNFCISSEKKIVTFLEFFDVGQARLSNAAKRNLLLSQVKDESKISKEQKLISASGVFRGRCLKEAIPLVDLLHKYNAPRVIDYFSLDVEGYEWEVFKKFSFNEYRFLCLSVERPIKDLQNLLEKNGYKLKTILGDDWMYVKV